MNFCPNCGGKKEIENAKFCPNCGFNFQDTKINEEPRIQIESDTKIMQKSSTPQVVDEDETEESEYNAKNAYALGFKFEDTVEEILKAKGYSTQRRLRLDGQKGKSEIDILAIKKYKGKEKRIAVECKNHTNSVSVKDIRDFVSKLEDLQIRNGLFVAYSDFSSEAESWGENACLELWDGDTVSEKFYELSVGRLKVGDKVDFKYYLPVKIDYNYATNLDFENKNKIEISRAKLIWRPFYKVFYELNSVQTDPIKRKHRITDSGFNIVDGLMKSQKKQKNIVSDTIKSISFGLIGKSAEEKKEDKERGILKKELRQNPDKDYSMTQQDNYKVIKHKPQISEVVARGETIDYVVEKNTETIEYEVPTKKRKRKDDDDFDFELPDIKEYTLKPSRKDVTINEIQLIHVPKWEVEFESGDYTYIRVISANGGTIIADNITNCNKHLLKDFIKKKNVAVCDVCGKALCKDHIVKCPTCAALRCEAHSIQCMSCKTIFCSEHIINKCAECGEAVCDACLQKCPICGDNHCNKHMTKCAKCGKVICTSCTRKEGSLIFKKTICNNC
ncbi:MAG: restriction endonuclease [Euryarchaeota archaeon]|nr:restriction endonuclease [Euryarchaeota archaeon]